MPLDDEILISAVQKREALWNPNHEFYKNVNVLKGLWEEVAQQLGKPVGTVKSRWRNLRSYFYDVGRRNTRFVDGVCATATITWHLYDKLRFLKKDDGSADADPHLKEDISMFVDYAQEEDPLALEVQSPLTPDTNSNSRPSRRSYSNENIFDLDRSELLELKRRKLDLLERESVLKAKNDDLLFFESLLSFMAQVPAVPKLRLRSAIQDLILQQLESQQQDNKS